MDFPPCVAPSSVHCVDMQPKKEIQCLCCKLYHSLNTIFYLCDDLIVVVVGVAGLRPAKASTRDDFNLVEYL